MRKTVILFIFLIIISIASAFFIYQPAWEDFSDFRPWKLGLDLSGGSYLVYDIDLSEVDIDDQETVISGLRDVIERRVNIFGVSEPKVYTQETDNAKRLVVELAGIQDVNQAINEIGETPTLDFREARINDEGEREFVRTDLTGRYVSGAVLGFEQTTGQPLMSIEFNNEGADIFEEVTGRNIGNNLCIFIDDEIRSFQEDCPVVQAKIAGGKAQITGDFTIEEAKENVARFNAGALPAPIELVNQQTVSSSLGQDSLDKSIKAGILGFIVIIIFMVAYYRKMGLFAAGALLMYAALLLGLFKLIPITLTLSGIAGVILSIGMAVDANILVFERTKEELKLGSSYEEAVEEGFNRAWSSIRDSNITTIISCVILYLFTTSFVKGFALALLIGVILSMFSAITITRTMMRVFYKNKINESNK
ncbi:MAG: protein translocase subunit SecD [Candidatus Paceibacterota bacterium]